MKLSEAIALGLPEIKFTNRFFFMQHLRGDCEGCLVGAALWASGWRDISSVREAMYETWPWTRERAGIGMPCPAHHSYGTYVIGGSRDHYDWTILTTLTHLASHYELRELTSTQIVDFIKSIEPPDPEPPEPPLDVQLAEVAEMKEAQDV